MREWKKMSTSLIFLQMRKSLEVDARGQLQAAGTGAFGGLQRGDGAEVPESTCMLGGS